MDPEELFRENLSLIDRTIGRVCRQARLFGADAEDFASAARLRLMENDYAVLRRFEGRCSLVTFLTIVVQRMLAQERSRRWGRFYESAAARRNGELGLRAEQLIRRDGRTIDDALPILRDLDPQLTRDQLVKIADRFAVHKPAIRLVDAEEIENELAGNESSEARVIERELHRLSDRVTDILRRAIAALSLEDRTIMRLHFHAGMTLAEIARSLGLAQRPLYRRLERILRELREALHGAGVDRRSIDGIIGSKLVDFDFGLQSVNPPSMQRGEPS